MPIKHVSFLQCAREILAVLNNPGTNERNDFLKIDASIYNMMTRIGSSENLLAEYSQYYKDKETEYWHHLISLDFRHAANVLLDPKYGKDGWLYIQPNRPDTREKDVIGCFNVDYKEYFSFNSTSKIPKEVFEQVLKFLDTLPGIFHVLNRIGADYQDCIIIKVHANVRNFIESPDSLVVGFGNKELKGIVRRVIEDNAARAGVTFARRYYRVESGFDFLNTVNGSLQSHSHLLSRIIANKVKKLKETLVKFNAKDMAEWLKAQLLEVKAWNLDKVHDNFY